MTDRKPRGYDNKCIHFNGTINEQCKAGVRYVDLVPEQWGRMYRLPCFKDNTDVSVCVLCHYPTPEEIAQHDADMEALKEQMRHRNAILSKAHTDEAQSKVFWCQLCDLIHVTGADAQQHLQADHGIVGPFMVRMLTHLDATDWYQTDEMLSVDGRDVLIRSMRLKRTGASRALWTDETPRRKRNRKK